MNNLFFNSLIGSLHLTGSQIVAISTLFLILSRILTITKITSKLNTYVPYLSVIFISLQSAIYTIIVFQWSYYSTEPLYVENCKFGCRINKNVQGKL